MQSSSFDFESTIFVITNAPGEAVKVMAYIFPLEAAGIGPYTSEHSLNPKGLGSAETVSIDELLDAWVSELLVILPWMQGTQDILCFLTCSRVRGNSEMQSVSAIRHNISRLA